MKSSLLLLSTALIWGLAFVAQAVGMEYVRTFTFNGVRFALGALSLIPVILIFEKGSPNMKKTAIAGVIGGAILFAASSFQQLGMEFGASAGKAGFITGLYTIIVPALGIFMGRKVPVLAWVGAGSAAVGMYFLSLSEGPAGVGIGDIALFVSAFFWAGHIIAIDLFAGSISPLKFSFIQFTTTSVLSLIAALIIESPTIPAILAAKIPIFYGGIFSVGIAYTLQTIGQKGVEPNKAAIIFSLEALFAAIGGALIINERLGLRGYIGCGFIFAGILLSQLAPSKGKTEKAGEEQALAADEKAGIKA
ncbi:MAG: DMT family transporter [Clostridiales bacterium]|nr:DMT family transporter [Clostridiales bacterium]